MHHLHLVVAGTCLFVASGCSSQLESQGTSSTAGGAGGSGTTSSHSVTVATTGGAIDIGQVSDVYPAPHPAAPQVVNSFGPVLTAPEVYPVLFTSDDLGMRTKIKDFSNKVGPTTYWTQISQEYGVGALTSKPAIELDEVLTPIIDDTQIQSWLAAKLNADDVLFPTPNANTLIVVYYPAGVSITLPDGQGGVTKSCQQGGFGGYHSNLTLDAAHGNMPVAYAVIPRCGGIGPVTTAASHELIEAATDPLPLSNTPAYSQVDASHIYWEFALGGGEVGDMCAQNPNAQVTYPEIGFLTQRSWSNASAKASHDPCVPVQAGVPYFNAVPVLPDQLNLGGLSMKGVKIPVGGTKTVDIKLFSDAPTGGDFTVEAIDASNFQGGGQTLDLSFDQDHGQNGQTLHLSINVLSATQYKAEIFMLISSMNGQKNTWVGIVGN